MGEEHANSRWNTELRCEYRSIYFAGVSLFVRLAKKGETFQLNPRSLGILSQGKLGSAV